MNELKQLQEMVIELNNTNSLNDKKVILKNHPECKQLLMYVYNPFWKYGVSSKNCLKRNDLEASINHYGDDIFKLLDELQERRITGHDAISAVNAFSCDNSEYKDLIWTIIDKNLKTRTDTKLINKVWKNLVPTFDVALANKFDDKTVKKVSFDGQWFSSRKLDGVRCITIVKDGNINFYSRAGNEFTTLEKVREALTGICEEGVFDGELCIYNDSGNEDFTAAVSQIKRKDFTIAKPCYKLFDMLTIEEFNTKYSSVILSDRISRMKKIIPEDSKILNILNQIPLTEKSFKEMQEDVAKYGWEGLILRKDTVYEGKRTKDMLKVKKFFDDEYVVKDVEMGKKPIMNNDGLMDEVDVLAAVKIEHKGEVVKVGSGWSDAQRLQYFKKPEEIIGKTITVQYFEESHDKDGKLSLRFPTVKAIYKNGRSI
jgi:DNA ligase 1